MILLVTFSMMFYFLGIFGVEKKIDKNKLSAISTSLDLCLRCFVKMAPENEMKSYTYKIILFITLICGMITFTHYECIFASTLIVESNEIPFQAWEEVLESDANLLIWKGGSFESLLKDSPSGSTLRRIYEEKIEPLTPEESVNHLGYGGTIPLILSGNYFTFESVASYEQFEEYPCEIISLKTSNLKYFNNLHKTSYDY